MGGSYSPLPEGSARDQFALGDRRAGRLSVTEGSASDHTSVFHFLLSVFHGPSRHEFRSSLEDPFYEPNDRLVIHRGSRIAGHVHITRRLMQFGPLEIPVSGVHWLGVLPELREKGYGRQLLSAAEEKMAADGALIGLTRTRIPYFFRPQGWALCGWQGHSQAGARAVLSGLLDRGNCTGRKRRPNIRPWRRMELGALVRLYNQNLPGSYGPLVRSEAYWEWLIARGAFDQHYVALDGPDLFELEERSSPVVGYVMTRAERIVELVAAPGHCAAALELLARCCGDAIEHGRQTIRLEAPPDSPLHRVFLGAEGSQRGRVAGDEVLMAKLLDAAAVLRALGPLLASRAEQQRLSMPVELGFRVDGRKYRLTVDRRGAKVVLGNIGRSYLQLNVADFTRLVLGHLDWDRAAAEGRVTASTAIAAESGRALFPDVPHWHPPLDDLAACR